VFSCVYHNPGFIYFNLVFKVKVSDRHVKMSLFKEQLMYNACKSVLEPYSYSI